MAEGRECGSRRASERAPDPGARADGTPGAGLDDLLARVARGDADALAAVCDQVEGPVYGLVSRIVGNSARSEQVTEEILLEVWRTASRFDPTAGSGLSWIIAIAQRGAARAAGPAASLLTHPGLDALPAPQRDAILLACCGYSWSEVADLARVPVRTVTRQLHDGLRQLSGPVSLLAPYLLRYCNTAFMST